MSDNISQQKVNFIVRGGMGKITNRPLHDCFYEVLSELLQLITHKNSQADKTKPKPKPSSRDAEIDDMYDSDYVEPEMVPLTSQAFRGFKNKDGEELKPVPEPSAPEGSRRRAQELLDLFETHSKWLFGKVDQDDNIWQDVEQVKQVCAEMMSKIQQGDITVCISAKAVDN